MDCIEYIDSINVSDGTFCSTNSRGTIVYTNTNAAYSVDGRVLVNSDEFSELSTCDYIQISFQLPILIEMLVVTGGTTVDSIVIYAKNGNGEFTCVCDPVSITDSVKINNEEHVPSNTYILLFPKPIAKKPIKLTIQLIIHQNTINQVLLAKYVTTSTIRALEKYVDTVLDEHLSKWTDRQQEISRVTSSLQEAMQTYSNIMDKSIVSEHLSSAAIQPTITESQKIHNSRTLLMMSDTAAMSAKESCDKDQNRSVVFKSRHLISFLILMLVLILFGLNFYFFRTK